MKEQKAIEDIQRLSGLCKFGGDCMSCNICYRAVPMAIEALEKQIPKKPNRHEEDIIREYYSCPNCLNNELDDIFDNYCPRCGQKLDWEVDE